MEARTIIDRCREVAACTDEPGHITRTFLSPAMRDAMRLVAGWMEAAGLHVHVDAAGNVRGTAGEGPRLTIGSHLDSVPRAGAFDGVLGVVIGIALAEWRPRCAIEVIAFSEEEGVRFGVPFIGSRALAGDRVMREDVLGAIRDFGLDPEAPVEGPGAAYLEFHIEQGPVLENLGLPLGVVEAIAGQSRMELTFTGKANHAGTTPMNLRQDALVAAAEWIGRVEREACATRGLVATVGRIEVEPGAVNVIPGMVRASLDVRHAIDDVRERAVDCLTAGLTSRVLLDQPAVPLDYAPVERAVGMAGYPVHRMASGAGHDAMILARRVPASMLFLRSPGGISHHPDEAVREEDVQAALEAGARFLENWRAA